MRTLVIPADGWKNHPEPAGEKRWVLLSYSEYPNEDGEAGWIASGWANEQEARQAWLITMLLCVNALDCLAVVTVWPCMTVRAVLVSGPRPFCVDRGGACWVSKWDGARAAAFNIAFPQPKPPRPETATLKQSRHPLWVIVDHRSGRYYQGWCGGHEWGQLRSAVHYRYKESALRVIQTIEKAEPTRALVAVNVGPASDN